MTIETIRLRRAALGCVLEALPKWKNAGIRVVNHSLKVNGEHREWLTIVRKDGSLILWEHFPEARLLGRIPATEVGGGGRVGPLLLRRLNAIFERAGRQ
jgi:hypothetical protein